MRYRIQVAYRRPQEDPRARAWRERARALPELAGLDRVEVQDLYFVEGELDEEAVAALARRLLADPVLHVWTATPVDEPSPPPEGARVVEVTFLPGVTDPEGESLRLGARRLGIEVVQAATGTRYLLWGRLDDGVLEAFARQAANPVVQRWAFGAVEPPFLPAWGADPTVETIPLRDLDDEGLVDLSRRHRLALDREEMRAIQAYFRAEGRDPTDAELETLAQTWSEHCAHKTFKARILYEERAADGRLLARETVDGLLNWIREATERLNRPWVRSAFVDNAGIVAFDDELDLALKVETHNHPSAVEPFGGANTGVGGVIRDVLGVSARPMANLDVLCFGPLEGSVPEGALPTRQIHDGVIAGIEDYGNKMGIPTVAGAILYHPGYRANPLVYAGCLGVLPRGRHRREPRPGDLVVVLGGRTGRDGLKGATFSSETLSAEVVRTAGAAVQIGDPIVEKKVQEAVLLARDRGWYTAITDCGAGGLSSAVGEMGAELGVEVDLARVPLKYAGLRPWEIWLSEAQERMVLAVPPEHWPSFQDACRTLEVEATAIGRFTGDGRLRLRYGDVFVADLSMEFLHKGRPRRTMPALWIRRETPSRLPPLPDLREAWLGLLAHPDVASKEGVLRRYDHEVQGGTWRKPLVGVAADAPGDGVVLRPWEARGAPHRRGAALGVGICPRVGLIDPYAMAWFAVDEAVRNVVAVGADPDRIALLDNFSWGDPTRPDRLGGLVRAVKGCRDAALAYGTPFISGKDSLFNEYVGEDGAVHPIPGTLLITALGIVPDAAASPTADLKEVGDRLLLVGPPSGALGGSLYLELLGGEDPLPPLPEGGPRAARAVHTLIRRGWARAVHDVSDGGLAVALAEMALGGRLGLEVDPEALRNGVDRLDRALFSEAPGRYLVEVAPDRLEAVATLLEEMGVPVRTLAVVQEAPRIQVGALRLTLEEVEAAFKGGPDGPLR